MVSTLISDLITNQKTELIIKSNYLICPFNTSYNHLICLFTSSVNHPVCVRHALTNSYYLWLYLPITFTFKMSDIGSGIFHWDVDKIINEVLKAWEKYGFEDMDLWKTFQEDFEGFTEEDFRSANNHNVKRL